MENYDIKPKKKKESRYTRKYINDFFDSLEKCLIAPRIYINGLFA